MPYSLVVRSQLLIVTVFGGLPLDYFLRICCQLYLSLFSGYCLWNQVYYHIHFWTPIAITFFHESLAFPTIIGLEKLQVYTILEGSIVFSLHYCPGLLLLPFAIVVAFSGLVLPHGACEWDMILHPGACLWYPMMTFVGLRLYVNFFWRALYGYLLMNAYAWVRILIIHGLSFDLILRGSSFCAL